MVVQETCPGEALWETQSERSPSDIDQRLRLDDKKVLVSSQLSGGQQQRVGVARAFIHGPSPLLADEPTGNLHLQQGRDIMALFQRLHAAGAAIIRVAHSEENAGYGHRTIRLRDEFVVPEPRATL